MPRATPPTSFSKTKPRNETAHDSAGVSKSATHALAKKRHLAEASVARDAFPADALRLSAAFVLVFEALKTNPKILQTMPDWADDNLQWTIQDIQEAEKTFDSNDRTPEIYIEASCFFRVALLGDLQVHVRDPDSGDILTTLSEDWFFPDHRVPLGFSDWIDEETPGPEGTIIRGKKRPMFLMRADFEHWFSIKFGAAMLTCDTGLSSVDPAADKSNRSTDRTLAHRRQAVKKAILDVYKSSEAPAGVLSGTRDKMINQWLKDNKLATVSDATIRRALSELRAERT